MQDYETFTLKASSRLKNEGFYVFISLTPNKIFLSNEITFEKIDYTKIGQEADSIIITNYTWGYSFGPPGPVSSINTINEFINYIRTQIPTAKIEIGQPMIAYDWPLPYVIGVTRANSLSLESTLRLANVVDAIIQFDDISKTPYFEYTQYIAGIMRDHIVWFIDARSIDSLLTLLKKNSLRGISIWNIMYYYPQLWLVINTQYEIETVL